MEHLIFPITGSKGDNYFVKAECSDSNLYISCTCQAGKFGKKCRHKIELLSSVLESSLGINSSETKILAKWCVDSGIDKHILEIAKAEKELELAKKHLELAERALSRHWVAS